MPAVLRQIGEPFVNNKGETVKPKALIAWCEGCGFEGATFGDTAPDGKRLVLRLGWPASVQGEGQWDRTTRRLAWLT